MAQGGYGKYFWKVFSLFLSKSFTSFLILGYGSYGTDYSGYGYGGVTGSSQAYGKFFFEVSLLTNLDLNASFGDSILSVWTGLTQ